MSIQNGCHQPNRLVFIRWPSNDTMFLKKRKIQLNPECNGINSLHYTTLPSISKNHCISKSQDDYKRISCQSLPSDLNQLVNQYLVIHWWDREYFMESAGVRYLRTSCWCIRNRTSELSERVRILTQKQRVRKYHTKHFPCGIVFIIYILRF